MSKDVENLKARLRKATIRAHEAERALGLIEDVVKSVSGGGVLQPRLVVADGGLTLHVQLQDPADQAFGEVADLALVDPEIASAAVDYDPDPVPEIASEPAPEPLPQDRPYFVDARKPRTGKVVTEAGLSRLQQLWERGESIASMAEMIGAPNKKWVSNVINRNRNLFPCRKKPVREKPVPAKPRAPRPAPPAKPAQIRPAAAVDTSRFTPEKDLTLARHMQAGDGIGTSAAILRIPRDICAARWAELLPEKTPEAIEALIRRLEGKLKSSAA